uniref:Uncharacterized protein n=1 Tax=Caenorhabditis tropicalis TaxID=1561998 RepID=A0A1I7TNY1_9PELO
MSTIMEKDGIIMDCSNVIFGRNRNGSFLNDWKLRNAKVSFNFTTQSAEPTNSTPLPKPVNGTKTVK